MSESDCVCDVGYAGVHDNCTACNGDFFSSEIGQTECEPCPTGYTTLSTRGGQTACLACAPEYYNENEDYEFDGIQADCHICSKCSYSTGSAFWSSICFECSFDLCPQCRNRGCFVCPYNWATEAEGATSVDMCGCPEGTELGPDQYCVECPGNTFSDSFNGTCRECGPGSIVTEDHTDCECPPGKARNATGCADCDEDNHKPSWGSDPCLPCPDGSNTGGASGATQCYPIVCGPGQQPDGFRGCVNCSVGTASDSTDTAACDVCPPGTGTRGLEGAFECDTLCPAGHETDGEGGCRECPVDKYNPLGGSEQCFDCAVNTGTNNATGATECVVCHSCPPGYQPFGNLNCTKCNVDEFSSDEGCRPCEPCALGSHTGGETGARACRSYFTKLGF